MIVEYNKSLFVSNVMEFTNRALDLASVEGKSDFSKYYLTEHSANWIDKMLILADSEVRRYLNHLLYSEENSDEGDSSKVNEMKDETIKFCLNTTHSIQKRLLPQLIEDAMVAYIAEKWCEENILSIIKGRSAKAFAELKSVSLQRELNRGRDYRIIG